MATDATVNEIGQQRARRRTCQLRAACAYALAFLSFGIGIGLLAGGNAGFWFLAFMVSCFAGILVALTYEIEAQELERKINGG